MRAIAFLIHGTFAPKSSWTLAGSVFRKKMIEGVDGIRFSDPPISWSGANTTKARECGIADLSKRLHDSLKIHPDVPHFVIGHSHGGLIALKAVERESLWSSVSVICLSTPFLHGRSREASDALKFGFWGGTLFAPLVLLMFMVCLAMITVSALQLWFDLPMALLDRIALQSKLLLWPFLTLLFLSAAAVWSTVLRAKHHGELFRSQTLFSEIQKDRLLLVGELGDEAAASQKALYEINEPFASDHARIQASGIWSVGDHAAPASS
jgi:pimeloyl-ACP methyl ester carboxylesterase